jgi:Protein of unknown function (DUF3043)
VRVFRRHSAAPADEPAPSPASGRPAGTPGKGRPTPKRSEAAPRRQPIAAPGNRKEAVRNTRERQRTERARRAEGLRRGDEKYLPAKDKGPVKALARDYVDSRRMLSEYYLYVVGVMFVLLFVPVAAVKLFIYPLVLATLVTVFFEGVITGRRVKKVAAQRFPDEATRGLALYAVMRAAQIRRFRLPPPRVERGAKI